ncbi:MAG TPA: response regulator [Oceanipulchritudo sp.]|nr:response regulator [Oceanipulchritudo sp.]
MKKSILIVDDDQDFSQLLRGVFQQAGYTVHTAFSADQGFEMLERAHIELIVTDHRLPGGITGTEFLRQLRERGITMPVVVVSGFLNDEAIRELIRDGVVGIFIKPLNIFSLLKKTNDVLEARAKALASLGADTGPDGPVILRSIGHIEGASTEGKAFLKKARAAAAFQRNLLLIGPKGTLFEEVARDVVSLSVIPQRCVVLTPGVVSKERLAALFEGEEGGKPLTLILTDAEKLAPAEVDALIEIGDEKGGSDGLLRMIFCLIHSVEDLYDNEVIDEEFYLFLGTNELKVPPLKKMPEDLVALAKKEIQEHSKDAVFDTRLRMLLLAHDWPENMVELRSVIVRATTLAQPMVPKLRHFEVAMNPDKAAVENGADIRSTFERFLLQEKRRYQAAMELVTEPQD